MRPIAQRTDDELNMTIALWVGWKLGHTVRWTDKHVYHYDWGFTPPDHLLFKRVPGKSPNRYIPGKGSCVPPNYCTCLDDVAEAAEHLRNQFTMHVESYWRQLEYVKPHPIFATARQRSEALVFVIEQLKHEKA